MATKIALRSERSPTTTSIWSGMTLDVITRHSSYAKRMVIELKLPFCGYSSDIMTCM